MLINFTKMQALGNDFIFIEDYNHVLPQKNEDISSIIKYLSNRKTGIGADQVIVISSLEYQNTSNITTIITIYNTDGTVAEACGNAFLCLGNFFKNKLLNDKSSIEIIVKTTGKSYFVSPSENLHSINESLSLNLKNKIDTPLSNYYTVSFGKFDIKNPNTLTPLSSRELKLDKSNIPTLINIGNPHIVLFASSFQEANKNIEDVGLKLQKHPLFQPTNGINVEYIFVENNIINMFVWERGVGRTLACGSGAVASFLAYYNNQYNYLASLKIEILSFVVALEGGNLIVSIIPSTNNVYITGIPKKVYCGNIEIHDNHL